MIRVRHLVGFAWIAFVIGMLNNQVHGQQSSQTATLQELKSLGAARSSYRQRLKPLEKENLSTEPRLAIYQERIKPALQNACIECHGPTTQEGNMRIDTLDPDLINGGDVARWLEVFAVLSNGEMPPKEAAPLSDELRSETVQWLALEIQKASTIQRARQPHTSFRRMTRYETNYALQDLLGVPYNFVSDLPPETSSEDGFQNSSELLHMSANQLAAYRELTLAALEKVTVGKEKPAPTYWGVSMQTAWSEEWAQYEKEIKQLRHKLKDDPEKLEQELATKEAALLKHPGSSHYKNLTTGQSLRADWDFNNAKYARNPMANPPNIPAQFEHVAILPARQRIVVELGDTLPETGTMRVRVRAARTAIDDSYLPSMQLEFGWQASNDSQASVRISQQDIVVDAAPNQPKFYQWDIPLCEVQPRNTMRKTWKLGDLPNPSEFLRIVNSSASRGDIQIDFVEVSAPVYDQWPPTSHSQIFLDSSNKADEAIYAEKCCKFLRRAWRREPTESEIQQKLQLFHRVRDQFDNLEQAMLEVLATALASPNFLYIAQDHAPKQAASNSTIEPPRDNRLTEPELATRLSMFLWCSIPDDELMERAAKGQLRSDLQLEFARMLDDARSRRFAEQFVQQWLGMQLLTYLKVDTEVYPQFDATLKEAMQEEPVAFFQDMLHNNSSVLDFLHADHAIVNERLAQHYGLDGVTGNHFRRVQLEPKSNRGGLLTQAGLLAMNSDGKDSHPLKRGIWMLKSLLNDPPPPPPPAVPVIDLTDPAIAKMTIKQRIENHRKQPACYSCHAKIDPWGIAFENFDATGNWRTSIQDQPVDSSSECPMDK